MLRGKQKGMRHERTSSEKQPAGRRFRSAAAGPGSHPRVALDVVGGGQNRQVPQTGKAFRTHYVLEGRGHPGAYQGVGRGGLSFWA